MSSDDYEWTLRSTFYRVLLEPMLLRWLSVSHNDFKLRGVPRHKCTSFAAYVVEARRRLESQLRGVALPACPSTVQLDEIFRGGMKWWCDSQHVLTQKKAHSQMKQLAVFLMLRTVLARVLESYVLLDRVQFMREQQREKGSFNVETFPVFEETISPRNMILMCRRTQS